MKRIIALALTLSLCCGLFVTAAFAEETSGEARTAPEGEAGAGETAPAETPDVPEPDAMGTLSFANLEKRVRENNLTIQALNESIASVNAIDFDKMEENMRDKLNGIANLKFMVLTQPQEYSDAVLSAIGMKGATFSSLQSSYTSLKSAFDDLIDGKTQRTYDGVVRQLNNAEDQMVMGAENLYVALLEMNSSHAELQRQLASVDRTLQEMELRYSMGQISALTLQQVKSGRASLVSGIATLERNIGDYTAQLEQLCRAVDGSRLTLQDAADAMHQFRIDEE